MLITVALAFWLGSSYIEYKIVKSNPRLMVLFHGFPGIIISLLIGAILSFAVGASNAMPIVVAQIVGLATNEIMFDFFAKMEKANGYRKDVQAKIAAHPRTVADFKTGAKGFFVFVGAFFIALGKVIRWVGATLNFCAHPVVGTKQLIRR